MKQNTLSKTIRPLVSGASTAGLAMTISSIPITADAQSVTDNDGDSNEATNDSTVLQKIAVTGQPSANTNAASTGIARMPASVKETPKIINVVPKELIEQQRATTLEQILKNVPGITLSTGEGRGGLNGDQFRIRGLPARGDIYTDGLKDFGAYKRDSFNTDSVQVIKGPSGESFGVGNVGGLINQSTKKARLGTSTSVDQSVGSGSTYRTTVDSNVQVNDTTAIRFNGMFQKGNVPDRDEVKDDRRAIAFDVGMGLGTDTEWHLGYSYLRRDGVPDYGIPMAQGADGIYRPLTEYGVPGYDSSTSYVRNTDKDVTNTHTISSLFSKELDNGITINNDTRVSIYDRDFSATNPAAVSYTNLQSLLAGTNVNMSYGAGGGMVYEQRGWAIQNVLSGKGEFEAGGFRHQAIVGLDVSYQDDHRNSGSWTGRVNDQTVLNPSHSMTDGAFVSYDGNTTDGTATNVGLFASDRVWLTDQFSLQGGLRWDYFRSEYESVQWGIAEGSADSRKLSPSISAIWEPTKDYMLYASFARTYRPVGTDIAVSSNALATEVPQDGLNGEPERSDTFEIGTKLDFLDGRLGVTGAIFQIDKDNAYTVDPTTGEITNAFSDNGEGRRIRGVELGLSGKITEDWSAHLAYAYLDGEVTSATDSAIIGNDAPGVAHHNVSLWTAYDLPEIGSLPGKFTVGGGFQYASEYWADSANTAKIPETFSLDAMVAYKQDNFRISLNAYNLTDHVNYESSFSAVRAVPASRRTFTINIGTTF